MLFYYDKHLSNITDINIQKRSQIYKSAYHLYIINFKNFNKNKKNEFIKYMKKNGVTVQFHYIPIYKFSVFKGNLKLKNSEKYYNTAISLPIYYDLKIKEQKYILDLIKNFLRFIKK